MTRREFLKRAGQAALPDADGKTEILFIGADSTLYCFAAS